MSNSSDPYPPLERDLRLTRRCLLVLKEKDLRVQVVTKSHLVTDDADLLSGMAATVAITITTLRESLSLRLEPQAPPPQKRLDALRTLREAGVPVSARIDPIIPGINDAEIEDLVTAVARAGAMHITSSTYKARPDSLGRICSAFPDEGERLRALFQGERRTAGCMRLQSEMRRDLMERVKHMAIREGVSFASCREDLAPMPAVNCDGSHLLLRMNAMQLPLSGLRP
jgi:DNA repair photolyase